MESAPRLLRKAQVLERTCLGRTKLHDLIRAGGFPAPAVYLSERLPVWRESDVSAWIEARVANSTGAQRASVVERMTAQRRSQRRAAPRRTTLLSAESA